MTQDVEPKVPVLPGDGDGRKRVRTGVQKPKKVREPRVALRLPDYFADQTLQAPAFLKALPEDKAARLPEEVVAETERLRVERDRDHKRLLALAAQPTLPSRIANWLWPTVLTVIRARAPSAFEPHDIDVEVSLRRLHREIERDLASEVPEVRQPAANILLLALTWLTTQRKLVPSTALQVLSDTIGVGEKASENRVRHVLTSGRLPEIQRAIAVTGLASGKAREAAAQRDHEKAQRVAAQERLDVAQGRVADLEREVAALRERTEGLEGLLAASQAELRDSRQHWGHDMTEVRTRQSSLLRDKVTPMLSDAVDALEIEPAEPGIALRRIRAVLSTIKATEN